MELSRRRFLQHAAITGIGAGLATSSPGQVSRSAAAAAVSKPLQVCLVSGSEEYKSNASLASFGEFLESKHPVRCSCAFWKSKTDLPGLESLDSCDLMVLFTKRLVLPKEQLDRIKKYCLSGRPILGLRTASHAFQNWLELDRDILGGNYTGHYNAGLITKIEVVSEASTHPILKGFKPFETTTKLYKNPRLADDTHLLLTGTIPEHTEPLAWTREHRGGRVFYTSLGGPEDFEEVAFRNMLVNAIFWAVNNERPS